ncbi:MAG: adenylosuccinate lyase [Phycisphaerales bacterium JB040]
MPSPAPTNPNDTYTSPLASRNASPEMLRIWSPRHKFNTWRRIWLAVAQAQHEVSGGELVTAEQVAELKAVVERDGGGITDEELVRAGELEAELRHDVMAHVHCLAERCPKAGPIIHLGCTSQDVVCNADLICLHESVTLLRVKMARAVVTLADEAEKHKSLPTLGFTHYQPAQPSTVGRRCAAWAHDLEALLYRVSLLQTGGFVRFRGVRGATGTQASFLKLFGDDASVVDAFERSFLKHLAVPGMTVDGEPATYGLTGQTYPRFIDSIVLSDLATVASALHKIATDLRLLSNRKEIDEPFGKSQIGSSAMPYKRNPMKCERICGLTRFVMNLVGNAYDTAATQWLERTLDDSSNRRLSLPEAFLALDGALDLMYTVADGLVVHEAMVRKNLMAELPFLATENILMEAVKAGGDRQALHEQIRVHAQAAGMRVKQEGLENDLIERLKADPAFAPVHDLLTPERLLDPMQYVGRAVEQTERFVAEVIEPLRERYASELGALGGADRGV